MCIRVRVCMCALRYLGQVLWYYYGIIPQLFFIVILADGTAGPLTLTVLYYKYRNSLVILFFRISPHFHYSNQPDLT